MQICDLTHKIHPGISVYPGTKPPEIKQACSFKGHGFVEHYVSFFTHTGTHVDAPYHILPHGKKLTDFTLEKFFGKAAIVNCIGLKTILPKHIKPVLEKNAFLDFLLIQTNHSKMWETQRYFTDYPILAAESADLIANSRLKGLGTDTISVDEMDSRDFTIHKILFGADMVIVENLTGLGNLNQENFNFYCMPMALNCPDGSPVRAFAVI